MKTALATAAMLMLGAGSAAETANLRAHRHLETLTITQGAEDQKRSIGGPYNGGRVEATIKSGAVMPGTVTAFYLASGDGRTGDAALGGQDEIDFEFLGKAPTQMQTNVFLGGQEKPQVVDLGFDSSAAPHQYAIEWDAGNVKFFVDGANVRTVGLDRPLAPMKLSYSLWTTSGGWPGLKKWAGETNWGGQGPISAEIAITKMP